MTRYKVTFEIDVTGADRGAAVARTMESFSDTIVDRRNPHHVEWELSERGGYADLRVQLSVSARSEIEACVRAFTDLRDAVLAGGGIIGGEGVEHASETRAPYGSSIDYLGVDAIDLHRPF